jgi:hypothetical protein
MPTGLRAVIGDSTGFLPQRRFAVWPQLELRHAGEPTTCSGGYREPLSPRSHELDAAARNDEGLETVRAQIARQPIIGCRPARYTAETRMLWVAIQSLTVL